MRFVMDDKTDSESDNTKKDFFLDWQMSLRGMKTASSSAI